MVKLAEFEVHTTRYNDIIQITQIVENIVAQSGVQNGMVFVVTSHTTTGLTANESLECLQSDMLELFARLAPEDHPYAHGRMLHSYGTTAGNPTGHLKACLMGGHLAFPVQNSQMVRGMAQDLFLCEFDGAQSRKVYVQVMGE